MMLVVLVPAAAVLFEDASAQAAGHSETDEH
jgi:hypothetical protein